MSSRRSEHGNVLVLAIIVVLVIAVAGVGIIRYASREVAGATVGRKEAAISACVEAGRAFLMSQWKLLGTHDVGIPPVKVTLETVAPTVIEGGHYGQDPTSSLYWNAGSQTWIDNIQVIPLNPATVGIANASDDLTNRIKDQVQPYRVVVHCTQGNAPDAREVELEFGVQYGL